MPGKNLTFWADIVNWINHNAPVISGAALAFIMAALRMIRSGESSRESFIEAGMCGGLSLGIITALEYFGLPNTLATLFGVIIGFLGTKKIAEYLDALIGSRIGGGKK